MQYWLNVPGVTFTLMVQGNPESITGTLVHVDSLGFTIKQASTGNYYGYGSACLQNAAL